MYGLPDSAILGTAKRVGRMGKIQKVGKETHEVSSVYSWLVTKLIDYLFERSRQKAEIKRIAQEHDSNLS
jgi:hypothetical protein